MAKRNNAKNIIIIGGGIGGLSAAIRLSAHGFIVTIVEKNAELGGKMNIYEADGFRWDTGPSVITMRHVFEDLFTAANRKLDDYLRLTPVNPYTRYFYRDGTIFDVSGDLSAMTAQIAELNERDIDGYLRYLAYAAQIHRITGPVFIYDEPPTPRSFARVPITDWLKADPLRTMQSAIKSHVKSPHLRQLLGRFATYVGGSPYDAPATLNVIAHVELTQGVWYPQGGIYRIAEAMEQLATELGVQIIKDTPVEQIIFRNNRAIGVHYDGSFHACDAVISNLDVTTTYEHLLDREQSHIAKTYNTLRNREPSCSGFVLLIGVEGNYPELAHHNILFSKDYKREFDQIFKQEVPPDDPTIYISITSKSDPEHAPEGHENWFILINAPALSDKFDWETQASTYRDLVIEKIVEAGFDIRNKITVEKIMTPNDLFEMSGAYRGALYGASANSKWTAFQRPHNRSKDIQGLYFVGGTTHPGGGVPMVTLSGKIVSDMVAKDLA